MLISSIEAVNNINNIRSRDIDWGYEKGDYSRTYWCRRGKLENLCKILDKLIPYSGSVENPKINRALERYRKATNCYYDLYSNGLCNRASEFCKVFGFGFAREMKLRGLTQMMIDLTEAKMDDIIQKAIKEQHSLGNIGIEDLI